MLRNLHALYILPSSSVLLWKSECSSAAAENRSWKQRMKWSIFSNSLSELQFRCMFRMSKQCFDSLCCNIEEASVGEDVFKSEMYLQMIEAEGYSSDRGRIYHLHKHYLGEFICGEIKLAVTLRLLAGGLYLDLAALYVCGFTYVYEIFHDVIGTWICNNEIFNIDFYKNLTDDDAMKKASTAFASGSSNGIMYGCIGALNGWLGS